MTFPILLTTVAGLALAFPGDGRPGGRSIGAAEIVEARVSAESLNVFDRPSEGGYIVDRLKRGDRVLVRWKVPAPAGWLAVAPPPSVVCWIEETAVERPEDAGPADHVAVGAHTRVRATEAEARSGNPGARLPGPPCLMLRQGDPVLLVDRPPLSLGSGRWLAIAPPSGLSFFAPADEIGWDRSAEAAPPPAAEIRAGYEPPADTELRRIDGVLHAIVTGKPVENWDLAGARAEYQRLLKARPDLDDAVKGRLDQIAQYEKASTAARRFIDVVSKSRRRDQKVAKVERKMAAAALESDRLFDAVGFIQPSSRMIDGRKVYALIGREGASVAYLDLPPGLDPRPLMARRVGVRGQTRFNADLRTRVIAVHDLVNLEPTR